jgi:hypothetical protein
MGIRERWRDFGIENPSARMFFLGSIDLCIAAVVALGAWAYYGVQTKDKITPPICYNYFNDAVPCSREDPWRVALWVIFGVVVLVLWGFHGWWGRRVRNSVGL